MKFFAAKAKDPTDMAVAEEGATVSDVVGSSEIIGFEADLEAAAGLIAGAMANLRAEEGVAEAVATDMSRLRAILGEDGTQTGSLGRPRWRLLGKSDFQQLYNKIQASEDWPSDMKEVMTTLREKIIDKTTAEQKWLLTMSKDELDQSPWTSWKSEMDRVDSYAQQARQYTNSDIRDVDRMMSGMGPSRYTRGKVLRSLQGRLDAQDNLPCIAGGMAYSRYLVEGERAAELMVHAASFIGGRRRHSPRSHRGRAQAGYVERDEEHIAAIYGGGCITPDRQIIRNFNPARGSTQGTNNIIAGQATCKMTVATAAAKTVPEVQPEAAATSVVEDMLDGSAMPSQAGIKTDTPWKMGENRAEPATPVPTDVPPIRKGPMDCVDPDCASTGANATPKSDTLPEPSDPEGPNWRFWEPDLAPGATYRSCCDELTRMMRTKYDADLDRIAEKRGFRRSKSPRQLAEDADRAIVSESLGRRAADPDRGYCRRWFAPTVGQILKWGGIAFLFVEVFIELAHEKSGCYVQQMRKDGSIEGSARLCPDATYPNGAFSWWPNKKIENGCSCQAVWNGELQPPQPPKNLLSAGCWDVGSPEARPCEKQSGDGGYNYEWQNYSFMDAVTHTFSSLTQDMGSCLHCITKLAAGALGGGLTSIFFIIVILIILYVVRWVYVNFFKGLGGGGGGSDNAPRIEVV